MRNEKKLYGYILGILCFISLPHFSYAAETHGFRFNNLSISPYINLEYTYDSNVNYQFATEEDDHIYTVNPGVDLNYKGNDWGINANAWFSHDFYYDNDRLEENSYGDRVDFFWQSPKGISVLLGQSFVYADQNDSLLTEVEGRGLWRGRNQYDFTGAVVYELSEKTKATLHGVYSDLWYDADPPGTAAANRRYLDLYGWEEISFGLELARQITTKSDFLLDASYQLYSSDGAVGGISSESTGYSIMGGFGSRMSDKITYRILAGMSMLQYAGGDKGEALYGFTYSANIGYAITRKLTATVNGSSQFQPSERHTNQAVQSYRASAGLSYRSTPRLTTSFDLLVRREETEYQYVDDSEHLNRYVARLMTRYKLKKYASVYAGIEYQEQMSDVQTDEFIRYRGIMGLTFRY